MLMNLKARWYFDVISPYAYLALPGVAALRETLDIEYVPILFAGLLQHWGQKGPAEIVPKRIHTYRACVFQAQQNNIPFRFPPAHPFNPLHALRLVASAPVTFERAQAALSFVWENGGDVGADWEGFCAALGEGDSGAARERAGSDVAKQTLIANTQRAVNAGVFGVPSFEVNGEVFWGGDSHDLLRAYLRHPSMFGEAEFRRVSELPVAAARV
jgi:2-hydroxychromene-2-carboxylate isomerase